MATQHRSIITIDKDGNKLPLRPLKPQKDLAPTTKRKQGYIASKKRTAKKLKKRRKAVTSERKKRVALRKEETIQQAFDKLTLIDNLPPAEAEITPGTLAQAFKGFGHPEIIECIRLAQESDPRLIKIITLYDALPLRERGLRSVFDTLCREVELAPDKFFGYISAASLRFNRGISMMHLAKLEPEVVQAIGKRATGEAISKDGGTADAATFLKASGLIREGKGSTVAVQVNTQVNNGKRRGLPAFEEDVVSSVTRVREERERMLTEGQLPNENPVVVDAQFEDVPT